MPYRKQPISNNNYYHIYNRGNNRNKIFLEEKNYSFLLKRIKEIFTFVAELNAFCFMPNHYHLSRYIYLNPVRAGLTQNAQD